MKKIVAEFAKKSGKTRSER